MLGLWCTASADDLVWAPLADVEDGGSAGTGGLECRVVTDTAQSGALGLRLAFAGAPTGEVYHAFASHLTGRAQALRFWMRVPDPVPENRMHIVFSSRE